MCVCVYTGKDEGRQNERREAQTQAQRAEREQGREKTLNERPQLEQSALWDVLNAHSTLHPATIACAVACAQHALNATPCYTPKRATPTKRGARTERKTAHDVSDETRSRAK